VKGYRTPRSQGRTDARDGSDVVASLSRLIFREKGQQGSRVAFFETEGESYRSFVRCAFQRHPGAVTREVEFAVPADLLH